MFSDSREGQKWAQNAIKSEEPPLPAPAPKKSIVAKRSKPAANTTAKRTHREYSEAIYRFINTTSCRVEVLDKEFDNPPREDDPLCYCDFHRQERGETSFRDLMKQEALENERTGTDLGSGSLPSAPEVTSDQEDTSDSDGDIVTIGAPLPSDSMHTKYRKPSERKLYVSALEDWVDRKFNSPECEDLDVNKDWILSAKDISNMARHPGLTSLDVLATLRPPWVHLERWGAEVLEVLASVTAQLEAREEARRQAAEAKHLDALERDRKAREAREQQEAERQRKMSEAIQASTTPTVPQKRRRPLPANATEEEKAARKEEIAQERRQKSSQAYWLKKAQQEGHKRVKIETEDTNGMPVASSSRSAASPAIPLLPKPSTPSGVTHTPPIQAVPGSATWDQQIVTFSAKQELLDDQERLLGISDANNPSSHSPEHLLPSMQHPVTPVTPAHPQPFAFQVQTPQDFQQSPHQPTPVSRPKAKGKSRQTHSPATQAEESPSMPRVRRKPKPKQPKNEDNGLPPQ